MTWSQYYYSYILLHVILSNSHPIEVGISQTRQMTNTSASWMLSAPQTRENTCAEQRLGLRLAHGLLVAQVVDELSLARLDHSVIRPVVALCPATNDAPSKQSEN